MYVKGVERSSKLSYTSLLITFLIFNQFSIQKSFGKLRLRTFQPYHTIYVGGVEGYFDLLHLQHASTYIAYDGMVEKL